MPHFDEPGKRLRNREGRRPGDRFDHPACAAPARAGLVCVVASLPSRWFSNRSIWLLEAAA